MIASPTPNSAGLRLRVRALSSDRSRHTSFSSHNNKPHQRSPNSVIVQEEGQALLEELGQPLLKSEHQHPSLLLDEQQHNLQDCPHKDVLVAATPSFKTEASTSATSRCDSSSSSPASKSSTSESVADYAARLHPTLIHHYYEIMSSLNKSDGSGSSEPLPALAFQEVVLGEIIGRGGFSFVHEIRDVKLQEIYDTGEGEAAARAAFAASFDATSEDGGGGGASGGSGTGNNSATSSSSSSSSKKPPSQQYVLKTLRPDLPEDEHNKGIIDLAVEAQFLAALSHPHILSLRGHANSDPLESRYFVILDRLVSTLDHKLKLWRKDVGINMGMWLGPCLGYWCGKTHVLHRIWLERFTVARDIASALDYLHRQDIVYRDLKPDNVGFNSEGELKMFDFGLAKRVTNADKTDDELYSLTGNTGSLRYMAPEVAKNMPYSLSVDAYSFGVLFWQLCALSVPYSGYSCKMHADLVVGKGYRPTPDASWPESWSLLMSRCWAADHRSRPSFEHVLKVINAELEFWAAEGEDFMESEEGKGSEKIKARRSKSVFKIRARKDRKTLDLDTRLTKPEGPTEKRHEANVV